MARRKRKRSRRRSPKKRRRRSRRRGSRRGPRKTRGLIGRMGALVLGVMPVAVAGADAIADSLAKKKAWALSTGSTVQYGMYRWLNDLSYGFLGTVPFERATLSKVDGTSSEQTIGSGLPKGSLWSVAGVGMLMLAYDWIAAKLAGGETKIPFTNYTATGSR